MTKTGHAILVLALGFRATLPVYGARSCHVIQAHAVGQDDGTGKTTGKVLGGGLLQGSIEGVVTPTSEPIGGVATFTEIVKFTPENGTLTVEITGAIDVSTGRFSASGSVREATGKLTGASGNLAFSGLVDFQTGLFTESIGGSFCVDLAP